MFCVVYFIPGINFSEYLNKEPPVDFFLPEVSSWDTEKHLKKVSTVMTKRENGLEKGIGETKKKRDEEQHRE